MCLCGYINLYESIRLALSPEQTKFCVSKVSDAFMIQSEKPLQSICMNQYKAMYM